MRHRESLFKHIQHIQTRIGGMVLVQFCSATLALQIYAVTDFVLDYKPEPPLFHSACRFWSETTKGDEMIPFLLLSPSPSAQIFQDCHDQNQQQKHVDRIGRRNISQHPTNFSRCTGLSLDLTVLLDVAGAGIISLHCRITGLLANDILGS